MIFIAWSYVQIMYMGTVWPFQEDTLNLMELFGEVKQYTVAFMIFFCQCGEALETQEEVYNMITVVGWAGFGIELFALVVNVFMAGFSSVKFYILQAKERKYKKAWKKNKQDRVRTKMVRQ